MILHIGIGLSFYNDFDSLRRLLQSLQSYPFDMIIAVDGRFRGHTGKTALSDKKTRDLFKGFQTPYTIIDAPDLTQMAKRQIYFDKSADYDLDVLIVMDTDEYVVHEETNWPLFVEDLNQLIKDNRHTYIQGYTIPAYIDQKRYAQGTKMNVSRLFYKPYELMYLGTHFDVRNRKTGVSMFYTSDTSVLSHFVIGTDHKLRTEQYMKQHDAYEQYQQTQEETPENIKKRVDYFIVKRDSVVS